MQVATTATHITNTHTRLHTRTHLDTMTVQRGTRSSETPTWPKSSLSAVELECAGTSFTSSYMSRSLLMNLA